MRAEMAEHLYLAGGLDALGDNPAVGLLAELDQRAGEGAAHAIGVDVAREADIELDEVGGAMLST